MALGSNIIQRTYGTIEYDKKRDIISITAAEPHVCIRLKHVFQQLQQYGTVPFEFQNTPEICNDLLWFMERYPLNMSQDVHKILVKRKKVYINDINERERILMPEYIAVPCELKEGFEARQYQLQARDLFWSVKRLVLADHMGLGKTISAIISMLKPGLMPAAVVVQTHLTFQWRSEIMKFTNLRVHIVQTRRAYSLPEADVYIFKYTSLSGWVDTFGAKFFKYVVFDECQELRCTGSDKYSASALLSKNADYCLALSGTPIYNYGEEIFNICNLVKPMCLGTSYDFYREWCYGRSVKEPKALGTYLREQHIVLRRTRADVGRELPPINTLVYEIEYDDNEVKKVEDLARKLAIATTTGSFMERGEAARELDMRVRQATGISKAKSVALWVRMFMQNEEPIMLAAWHREVYEIWLEELAEFNPVMYTGSETPKQKEEAKQKFISGQTKLFIISLRSGVGIDGLQQVCKTIIFGELDWSPKVHDQLTTRLDRDGQQEEVTAIYLTTDWGSDPVIIDLLGVKSSQAHGIVDPMLSAGVQHSDESRIKRLAAQFLDKKEEFIEAEELVK